MNREEVFTYIKKKYKADPDYPWPSTPNTAILRHQKSRKWFAAVLDITEDKLGLEGDRLVDVLNLKCEPMLVGSLRGQGGIYPAYHMNKEHWISILLDSEITTEQVCSLIDLSYDLTSEPVKKVRVVDYL